MGAAGLVRGLAGTVEVAQRPEALRGVPRVERQQVDPRRAGAGFGGVDVLVRNGQGGHRQDGRDVLPPLDRAVLDGGALRVHVTLHAQLEDHVRLTQPLGQLAPQVVGIGARRVRGRRGVHGGPQLIAHRSAIAPQDRAPAPVRLQRQAAYRTPGSRDDVASHTGGRRPADRQGQLDEQGVPLAQPRVGTRHGLGEGDEFHRVAGVGDRETRHQQIVGLTGAHLDAQRRPAQIGREVGLTGPARVGQPDRDRVLGSRPGETRSQGLGKVVAEPQPGVLHAEDRLGVEGPVDGGGAAALLHLELHPQELTRQPLEDEPLGFRAPSRRSARTVRPRPCEPLPGDFRALLPTLPQRGAAVVRSGADGRRRAPPPDRTGSWPVWPMAVHRPRPGQSGPSG